MTKFTRLSPPFFDKEGLFYPVDCRFDNGAHLEITEIFLSSPQPSIRLKIGNWWFDRETLNQLIAELIFIKEEFENHPSVLERQQEEDMMEIHDEEEIQFGEPQGFEQFVEMPVERIVPHR